MDFLVFCFLFFTAQTVSEQISIFSRQCCNETISLLEKSEENRSNSTGDAINGIGESYYRLAIFSLKQWKNHGTEINQIEMEKLLIKSILRGMRCDSKNARLQFPRLFQIVNINTTEMTDLFNAEVRKNFVQFWAIWDQTKKLISTCGVKCTDQ